MFWFTPLSQNEHELDLPQFISFGKENTVTQQILAGNQDQMMQAFGVKPVVLVEIYMIQWWVFFTQKVLLFSTFLIKTNFSTFQLKIKLDLLIEYVIPWYFQFVAGWQRTEPIKDV